MGSAKRNSSVKCTSKLKKRLMKFGVVMALLLAMLPMNTKSVNAETGWTLEGSTGWIAAYSMNNQNDYLSDQQTGSGEVSQDIVGNTSKPAVYKYMTNDVLAFRVRVNANDFASQGGDLKFKNFVFVGIDADLNGTIDFFMGAYDPSGTGRVGIYNSDPTISNSGPSSTGISGKPLLAFQPVRGMNYAITQADSSFGTTGTETSGSQDYFVSFSFSVADVNKALQDPAYQTANNKATKTFTGSTAFAFITGTASQDNSFNQDINGMNKSGWTSGSSWSSLGVFSPITSADGTQSGKYASIVFDKNTGTTEANPNAKKITLTNSPTVGTLPANPTKTGMQFKEWNTSPDGTGTKVTENTPVTGSATYFAIWASASNYTITFNPNGGIWSGSISTIEKQPIDGIIGSNMPADPTQSGKTFVGWATTSNATAANFTSSTPVNSSYIVYAVWMDAASTKYSAVFKNNFSSSDESIFTILYANNGGQYNVDRPASNPSHPGYTFKSWSKNKNTIDALPNNLPGNTNQTYYAIWEKANTSFTLTFNGNGTTINTPSRTITNGVFGIMPEEPIRDGYEFQGWKKNSSGSGDWIYPGSIITGNTEVFAIWNQVPSVTFNANSGSFDAGEQTVKISGYDKGNSTYGLRYLPQPPAREGYTFLGWNRSSTATNPQSLADYTIANTTTGDTLYAVWDKIVNVTFHVNGGMWSSTTADDQPKTVNTAYGSVMYLPFTPILEGYTFKEWNINQTGGSTGTFDLSSNVSEPLNVYAQWLKNYQITYTSLEGSTIDGLNPSFYTEETATFTLINPTKSGYDFLGWTGTGLTQASKNVMIEKYSTGNRTYQANWVKTPTASEISVAYLVNNAAYGSVSISSETVTSSSLLQGSTATAISGSQFLGFKNSSDKWVNASGAELASQPANPESTLKPTGLTAGTHVYTAYFEPMKYILTLTYDAGVQNVSTTNTSGYDFDSVIPISATLKDGYQWVKWESTDTAKIGHVAGQNTSINMPAANITLKATTEPVNYSITYTLNEGTNSSENPSSYMMNSSLITLANPTRTGYMFDGWYTTSNFDGSTKVTTIPAGSTGNKTFYAKWVYYVSYDMNYANPLLTPGDMTIDGDTHYTKLVNGSTISRPGYIFDGWYKQAGQSTDPNSTGEVTTTTAVDSSIKTLYAHWKMNVSFDSQGGTSVSDKTAVWDYPYGTLTTPVKDGYAFAGWYKNAPGTGLEITEASKVTDKNSHTLYAQWTGLVVTLTRHDTATATPTDTTVTYGQPYGLALPTPVNKDTTKIFAGWYTTPETGGILITSETIISEKTNHHLYARWTDAQTYIITYNGNGNTSGTLPPNSSHTAGSTVMIATSSDLAKTGYTFEGWSLATSSDIAQTVIPNIGADVTLYAIWKPIGIKVSFDTKGATTATPNDITATFGDVYPTLPSDLIREGYTFRGWLDQAGTLVAEFFSNAWQTISTVTKSIDHTLDAFWVPISYDVTYLVQGGTFISRPAWYYKDKSDDTKTTATAVYGKVYGAVPEASKEGYDFGGWFAKDAQGNYVGDQITDTTKVTIVTATNYYAKWTTGEYSIAYTLNGGIDASNPAKYTINTDDITLANPEKPGYTFDGWYSSSNYASEKVTKIPKGSTGNKKLYAKWTPKEYTVTFNAGEGAFSGTTNTANKKQIYDTNYDIPSNPTRPGYEFSGWKDSTNKIITDASKFKESANQTLTAIWTELGNVSHLYGVNDEKYGSVSNSIQSLNPETGSATGSKATPAKGYRFVKWQDSKGIEVSTSAEWIPAKINGKYKGETYTAVFAYINPEVILKKGNQVYGATALLDEKGNFTIDTTGMPAGIYNMYVTVDDKTTVVKIEVKSGTALTQADNPAGSLGNVNSNLKVKTGTPEIVVGKLHNEANFNFNKTGKSGFMKVEMTVEKVDHVTANPTIKTAIDKIDVRMKEQNATIGLYLDLQIDQYSKTLETASWQHDQKIKETNELVEIIIPLPEELKDKSSYVIYRDHEGVVTAISSTPNAGGEYLTVDNTTDEITMHVKKFSVYAIAYVNTPVDPSTPVNPTNPTTPTTPTTPVNPTNPTTPTIPTTPVNPTNPTTPTTPTTPVNPTNPTTPIDQPEIPNTSDAAGIQGTIYAFILSTLMALLLKKRNKHTEAK